MGARGSGARARTPREMRGRVGWQRPREGQPGRPGSQSQSHPWESQTSQHPACLGSLPGWEQPPAPGSGQLPWSEAWRQRPASIPTPSSSLGGPGTRRGFSAPACPWLSSTHLGKRCERYSWAVTSRPGREHGVPLTPEADTGVPWGKKPAHQGPLLLARHTDPPSFSPLPPLPPSYPSLPLPIRASLTWQPTTQPSPSSWKLHRLLDSHPPERPEWFRVSSWSSREARPAPASVSTG